MRLVETPVVESETVHPGVTLDYDENGRVVGVEIFGIVDRIDRSELRSIQLEVA
jgi:uncharacterized protein YuzE